MLRRVDDGREQNRAAGADAVAERARRGVPASRRRRRPRGAAAAFFLLPFVAACCGAEMAHAAAANGANLIIRLQWLLLLFRPALAAAGWLSLHD